jgi:hypothetical protein
MFKWFFFIILKIVHLTTNSQMYYVCVLGEADVSGGKMGGKAPTYLSQLTAFGICRAGVILLQKRCLILFPLFL